MSEILRKWLSARLGIFINYDMTSFGEISQDGTLVGQILENYGIINLETLNCVKSTYDVDIAYSNLVFLRPYLNALGLMLTEKTIHNIAHKDNKSAMQLFYQLYVCLNTKCKINYLITKNIQKHLDNELNVGSPAEALYNACYKNEILLSKDINNTREILKWHKQRYLQLMKNCKYINEDLVANLDVKLKQIEIEKYNRAFEPTQKYHTVKMKLDKVKVSKIAVKKPSMRVKIDETGKCVQDVNLANKYIQYLKAKQRKYEGNKILECQNQKILMEELLKRLVDKEDEDLKLIISRKLLKASCYEQQIVKKIFDIRHQKEVILQNLQNEHKILDVENERKYFARLFQQSSNISLREHRYRENRDRQLELHRRMYAEKCAAKYKRDYIFCGEVTNDIVSLAMRKSEFRDTYGYDIPNNVWREWVNLFCRGEPIFDVISDVTDLLDDFDDVGEPITIEYYRQNGLDECDFSDYDQVYAIWNNAEALEFYEENRDLIDRGTNILSFIVHRLLLLKYPYPVPPKKPDLKHTDIRTCLLGIDNHEVLPILQQLLTGKKTIFLEVQTVVNHFMTAYLHECSDDLDNKLIEETAKGGKAKSKKVKPKKKPKPKKGGKEKKSGKNKVKFVEPVVMVADETQTPRIFPGEEVILSKRAELGKLVYETVHIGQQINDHLITEMLIEYLKQLTYINGWVLVNYPETVSAVYSLEEALNGVSVPGAYKIAEPEKAQEEDDDDDLVTRTDPFVVPSDPYVGVRTSRILKSPNVSIRNEYDSCLTSFVQMQITKDDKNEMTDNAKNLTSFYDQFGINHPLPYSIYDEETVTKLMRYITNDDAYVNYIYEEILDAVVKLAAARAALEKGKGKKGKEKKGKGKKGKGKKDKGKKDKEKKEKKEKKDKKGKDKKGKGKKGKKDKAASEPQIEHVEPKPVLKSPVVPEVIIPPKPGEASWQYAVLDLPEEVFVLLATKWQSIEEIYANDLKQVFFFKRVSQNQIIPYVHEIDTHMQNYIERPDSKQEHLHQFQKTFTEIDFDMREDDEFKSELYYRLLELREKLWYISDERMNDCEEERRRIIAEGWFVNHCIVLTNLFIKGMQIEIDRYYHTMVLIQDYYSTMVLKKPLENKFPVYTAPLFDPYGAHSLTKKSLVSVNDKTNSIIANMLIDTTITTEDSPFVLYLNSMSGSIMSYIHSVYQPAVAAIKGVQSSFLKKPGKKISPRKKKVEVNLTEHDIILAEKIGSMVEEWACALEGELLRSKFRIKLIHGKAVGDINENLYYAEQLFHDVHQRIDERYVEEVASIDAVCHIFGRAIEACQPIRARLVLDGANYYVEKNTLFYADYPFTYETIKENIEDTEFSIAQLHRLTNIFLDLAPTGSLPTDIFIYLLQDMITMKNEDGFKNYLPEYWYHLNNKSVLTLTTELYNLTDYIDWRDFIVWNMRVPYPSDYELLDARRQFKLMDPDNVEFVNAQQFDCVNFWFDSDYNTEMEEYKLQIVKQLLCKMFRVAEDKINYTGLLLYFCKDIEPMLGVAKALELATGSLVCYDRNIGQKFKAIMHNQKKIENREKRDAVSAAVSALDTVFKTVIKQVKTPSYISFGSEEVDLYYGTAEETMYSCSREESVEGEEGGYDILPPYLYFLSLEVLIKVMTVTFPFHSKAECFDTESLRGKLESIYDGCRRKEFDDKVFMHEFLNNETFLRVLEKYTKFLIRSPTGIAKYLVEVCTCPKTE